MPEIKDILKESNRWWKEKFSIEFKEREVYKKIIHFMKMPQIIALTGLRRVGKTTIMFKIIEDKIKEGIKPENIIYFSFDEFRDIEIRKILKNYGEIMDKNLNQEKYLLLLDEVQKLEDWEEQLKRIYDNYKNIKIIISGSESLFLKKKSRESLAGRLFEFQVKPLTFLEFINFKNLKYRPIELYKEELLKLFEEFTYSGGFPELVNIKDKEIIKKFIKETIIEKIIYRDIPSLFPIKDTSLLESLFNVILYEPGQIIEINKLARNLGISRQVTSTYLKYIEGSYLIVKLYNFSKSRRKTERKLKKYYPVVPAITRIYKDDELTKAKVFENTLILQLDAEFFWRDPYKNEVDIVRVNKELLPIEIKYGKNLEIGGLLKFMEKFKVNTGIIISLEQEKVVRERRKSIKVIPIYKFLLS